MSKIIDGKELAKKVRLELKDEVEKLKKDENIHPKLAVIMVGSDPASQIYVRNKSKACDEIGIEFEEFFKRSGVGKRRESIGRYCRGRISLLLRFDADAARHGRESD